MSELGWFVVWMLGYPIFSDVGNFLDEYVRKNFTGHAVTREMNGANSIFHLLVWFTVGYLIWSRLP